MSPTFNPPTRGESIPGKGMWPRFDVQVGVSIVRVNGTLTEQPYPLSSDLLELEDGVDYFLGGHEYTVTEAVATELTNAGFGSGLS